MKKIPAAGWVVSAVGLSALLLAQTPKRAEEKIKSGQGIFLEYSCFVCHGQGGKGGIKNPNAVGGTAPALSRVAEGYTVEELKKKILEGVPKVGKQDPEGPDPPLFMPSWKGILSEEQVNALAAYLMSLLPESEKEKWE